MKDSMNKTDKPIFISTEMYSAAIYEVSSKIIVSLQEVDIDAYNTCRQC